MDLKELKQIWKEHGFSPRKPLGQNFLIDKNIKGKILDRLQLKEDSTVIEIGPGFGIMSFDLAERCGKLIAIDKDARVCEIMRELFKGRENITLINADVLETDLCGLVSEGERVTVYGNIPYYISTPIIKKIITQRRCIDVVYMVIQDELANRMISPPGPKEYGSLSCFVQFYIEPKKLFRITKNCFYPRPKVDSCLMELKILEKASVAVKDEDLMFRIIRKSFSQRRKKVINSLSAGGFMSMERDEWLKIFRVCGIDPASRAEKLSLAEYARLSDEVLASK